MKRFSSSLKFATSRAIPFLNAAATIILGQVLMASVFQNLENGRSLDFLGSFIMQIFFIQSFTENLSNVSIKKAVFEVTRKKICKIF